MILYRNVFHIIGIIFLIFSGVMLFPAVTDFVVGNETSSCFFISFISCCFLGGLLFLSTKTDEIVSLNSKEKTIFVLLIWFSLPFLGMLPFVLSPFSISAINALFEAASALTTTGSTACNVSIFSEGFLLWRAILQFFGGILFVFTSIYIFPTFKYSYGLHSGTENYSLTKAVQHTNIFVIFYVSLVFISSFFLIESELPAIDSICYSLASISSGGMFSDNTNIYHLNKISWILSILIFMSGISIGFINNFIPNGAPEFKNRQFIFYLSIILVFITLLTIHIFYISDNNIFDCLRKSTLTIISSITTTGIAEPSTENFGNIVNAILYILNFCGGCSGSCTGGIKIFRIMLIFLILKTYFIKLTKSNAVYIPSFDGRRIDEFEIISIFSYFICYLVLAIVFSTILSFSEMDFGKAFGSVITTMNNNGPFFGLYKATSLQISALSAVGKSILIIAMISGRVEFVLFFMIASRTFWKS